VGLQKVEKEVWQRSALGAALAQLVGDIIQSDYPNGIVALSL